MFLGMANIYVLTNKAARLNANIYENLSNNKVFLSYIHIRFQHNNLMERMGWDQMLCLRLYMVLQISTDGGDTFGVGNKKNVYIYYTYDSKLPRKQAAAGS